MTEYTSAEAVAFKNERLTLIFDGYCSLTRKLLGDNQQGLTLPIIQSTIGMSAKTAKRVLTRVATERDGKYYPQAKGVRK